MGKLALVAAIAVVIAGCGRTRSPSAGAVVDAVLSAKVTTYLSLLPAEQDAHGFVDTGHCDSLLFTALSGVGGGTVDLTAARDADGRWHRRPTDAPECYPADSSTTISRDMLLGVFWYAWATKNRTMAEGVWAYGEPRSWIMGDGDRSIVTLTPNNVATLAQIIYSLGGADHAVRVAPLEWPTSLVGFEAHLEVLEILLRERVYGNIEKTAVAAVSAQAKRQVQNPLFLCANGDVAGASAVLKNEAYWPATRLPSSNDRCDPWLNQRDFGADWQPCPSPTPTVFSGGDFLFTAALVTKGWCG